MSRYYWQAVKVSNLFVISLINTRLTHSLCVMLSGLITLLSDLSSIAHMSGVSLELCSSLESIYSRQNTEGAAVTQGWAHAADLVLDQCASDCV